MEDWGTMLGDITVEALVMVELEPVVKEDGRHMMSTPVFRSIRLYLDLKKDTEWTTYYIVCYWQ